MAIVDRIGYYTVFEDGHIVKGKDWYPLITESDFLNQEIKIDRSEFIGELKPCGMEFEWNIWGQIISSRPLYDEEELAIYNHISHTLHLQEIELNEKRKKELKNFIKYRKNYLKKIRKAYIMQEKNKYLAEKKSKKAYRDRLKKRIKEYRAYMATQPKTFNLFGVKITYRPKKKEPRVVQKRTIKILGRQIEIER